MKTKLRFVQTATEFLAKKPKLKCQLELTLERVSFV